MTGGCLRVVSLSSTLLRYAQTLELQEALAVARKAGAAPDTLLVLQHHPVFTVGKRGTEQDFHTDAQELRRLGIDVARVPRGGETTYHGPGQLVAYPILNLRGLGLGARAYVEALEDAMVLTAGCFGIQARGRVPDKSGVWVGERKLGAVGVRISHGISSHGIALNVATDLAAYRHIVPCGTPDKEVTSLRRELMQRAAAAAAVAGAQPYNSSGGGGGVAAAASSSASALGGARQAGPQHQQRGALPAQEDAELMALAEACLVDSVARCLGLQPAPEGAQGASLSLGQLLSGAASARGR